MELLDKQSWREEAAKPKSAMMMGAPTLSPDKVKQAKERRQKQLKRNRSYYSSATEGNPLTLKWVPKLHPYNVVRPAEASGGTTEVPRDTGEWKFGVGGGGLPAAGAQYVALGT